jgi:hypothetical protein
MRSRPKEACDMSPAALSVVCRSGHNEAAA